MMNDVRSSLQKAAAKSGGTSSLSNTSSNGRRGSNGYGRSANRRTVTSFEVSAPAAACSANRPAVAASIPVDTKTTTAYMISDSAADTQSVDLGDSKYTVGHATAAITARGNSKSKKKTKSTQHFTIISACDEQQQQQQQQEQQQNDSFDSTMDIDHHHHHEINRSSSDSHNSMMLDDTDTVTMLENRQSLTRPATKTQTSFQIGFEAEKKTSSNNDDPLVYHDYHDDRTIEQMEGVIDQGTKMPLVVLDGANVAYAYATAMSGMNNSSLGVASSVNNKNGIKLEPDARGIQIATDFFSAAGVRALVVLPQYWFRGNNNNHSNNNNRSTTTTSMTLTSQLEILSDLKKKGLIVASPPTDDDDAYALTISRREESRSCKPLRNGEGPGFVLSNDLFRDAQGRDPPCGTLKEWLTKGRNDSVGPGRISYTFGDMGSMNDRGERVLDFVPNPRHPLVVWMENHERNDDSSYIFSS